MAGIRDDERSRLESAVESNTDHVHVYGEPGIGKSTLVKQTLDGALMEILDSRITVRKTFSPETVEKEVLEELRELTSTKDELQSRTAGGGLSFSIPGLGGLGGSRTRDERERDIHKLEALAAKIDRQAILWLDDVHKIADDRTEVQDCIEGLSDNLPETMTLLTSGRIPLTNANTTIELAPLSPSETKDFLCRTFPNIAENTTDSIHEQVDGHPYFLDLLMSAADSPDDLDLPEGEVYRFIEDEYLATLSPEEERLLRQTSVLTEFDESICTAVVPDFDPATIRQTLDALRDETVIRVIDRTETGERIYSMHDRFQKYLYDRLDNEAELHRRAFQYYVRNAIERTTDPKFAPLTTVGSGIFAQLHLQGIYDGDPTVAEVEDELDRLDLSLEERRLALHGIVTYLFDSPDSRAELMRAETRTLMEQIQAEKDVSELQSISIQLYMDVFRSVVGADAEGTPNLHKEGYYDELLEDIRAIEWEDADSTSVQFFEDVVSATVHGVAIATATQTKDGKRGHHEERLFKIASRYGLGEDIAREVASLTREFLDETLPRFDIDSTLDAMFDDVVGDAFDSGSTRKNLREFQEAMPNTLLAIVSTVIETKLAESEEIFEYSTSVEQALSNAENPLFVAFWTRLWEQIYTVLGPNGERASHFETQFERAKERRIEYETTLANPCIEIEQDELLLEAEFAEADAETELQELVDFE